MATNAGQVSVGWPTYHPKTCTVNALPPEIMKIIFEYVQLPLINMWDTCIRNVSSGSTGPTIDPETAVSFVQFPRSPYSVCRYWREIMSAVPAFWSTIVTFAGIGYPSEVIVGYMFALGQHHPIDLVIFGSPSMFRSSEAEWSETEDIRRVLDYLNPHLHRCRSLFISAEEASPLRLVYENLRGDAPLLANAVFHSSLHRAIEYEQGANPIKRRHPSTAFYPSLTCLFLDGTNFHEACEDPDILSSLNSLRSLTVSHYRAAAHKDPLSVSEVLAALAQLPCLRTLNLQDTIFEVGDRNNDIDLQVTEFAFTDMPSEVICDFFSLCTCDEICDLRICNSWVQDGCIPYHCPTVILQDLPPGNSPNDALQLWYGRILMAFNCLDFDETTLAMFTTPHDASIADDEITQDTDLCCNELTVLALRECPCISLPALKSLIEKRNRWVDYGNPDWKTLLADTKFLRSSIRAMDVTRMGYILAEEDVEWFSSRLLSFESL